MKKRFFAILSSLLFSFAFFSCDNSPSANLGSVNIAFPKTSSARAAQSDTSVYEITLSYTDSTV